eukprot:gene155-biopygen142
MPIEFAVRERSPVCHAHERGGHLHVSVATLMGHLDVRLWYAHDRVNHDIHLCELLVGGLTNWHADQRQTISRRGCLLINENFLLAPRRRREEWVDHARTTSWGIRSFRWLLRGPPPSNFSHRRRSSSSIERRKDDLSMSVSPALSRRRRSLDPMVEGDVT